MDDLQIAWRPLGELIPYARNPRTHYRCPGGADRGQHPRVRLDQPGAGRWRERHHRRARPGAGGEEARAGAGAGDRARAHERGAEARLCAGRQPAGAERRLGRGAAAARAGRSFGARLRPRADRLRRGRAGAAAGGRGQGGPDRGRRGAGAAGAGGHAAGRSVGAGRAPAAVRRRDGAGRCRARAGRAARRHDVHRSALQRGLRQLGQGQAAGQQAADPERRSRRRLRGVPARRLRQHPRGHQGRGATSA